MANDLALSVRSLFDTRAAVGRDAKEVAGQDSGTVRDTFIYENYINKRLLQNSLHK
jgi:hypothetical protein